MGMAAHRIARVDHFDAAREEFEVVLKSMVEAGASHHVTLEEILRKGLMGVGARVFQGHLDALFEAEAREVPRWARPEGSTVRVRARELEKLFADRGCSKTGEAHYNLEVAFYPVSRLLPKLTTRIKRRVERYQATWMCIFATGYILRCQRPAEQEV